MAVRGRTLFAIIEPILTLLSWVLRLLPRPVCEILFAAFRHVPWKLGVAIRFVFVKRLAKSCGRCVAVFEGVHLLRLRDVVLGDNVSIHPMCYLDGTGGLTIGNDVSVAHSCSVMTTEHDFRLPGVTTRDAPCRWESVHIGEDVWLGCGVRVLAGVTIESGSVIGAGAVVTRDVSSGTISGGVPARVIGEISDESTGVRSAA